MSHYSDDTDELTLCIPNGKIPTIDCLDAIKPPADNRASKKRTKRDTASTIFENAISIACQACDNLDDMKIPVLPKANRVNLVAKINTAAANLLRLQNQPLQEEDERSTPIERDLDDLASTIRTAHEGVTRAAANMIEFALTAGDALLQAKAQAGHGNWLRWLKTACDLSEDRAERYMKIARGRAVIEAKFRTLRNLGLTEALRLIDQEKRKSQPPTTKPLKSAKAADRPQLDPAAAAWNRGTPKERDDLLRLIPTETLLAEIRRRSDQAGPVIDLTADEIPPFLQRAA